MSPSAGDLPVIPLLHKSRLALVWLMFASAFVVTIEPAPTDLFFMLAFLSFMWSGLRITIATLPLVVFLLLYNIGALLGYTFLVQDHDAMMFVITSSYMAVSAMFLSFFVAEDTERRMEIIRSGLYVSAVIAAIFAILDYFSFPGIPQAMPGRATGLFKDPNVFSTFIIYPMVLMLQSLMLGKTRHPVILALALFVVLGALFLSFSRGAWINFLMAATLLVILSFALNPKGGLRSRILVISAICIVAGAVGFAALMSFEQIRTMFTARFALVQSYDGGETGRFGNQLNSIPMLINLPLGFGPLQFGHIFTQAPHNTFVNAFASYGWLGGVSFILLIVSTFTVGFKAIFDRRVQSMALGVFCPLVSTTFQGIQIDSDHWRHFYWLLGLSWGLYAATLLPQRPQRQH